MKKIEKLKYMVRKIEVTQVATWFLHVNVCLRYTMLNNKNLIIKSNTLMLNLFILDTTSNVKNWVEKIRTACVIRL